jgi:hypothetical protein
MVTFGRLTDLVNAEGLEVNPALRFAMQEPGSTQEVIDLNTWTQLFGWGEDATGRQLSDIGGPYADFTVELKAGTRPNNSPFHVDLYDTGDFYESFTVKVLPDGLLIQADTIKDGDDLRQRWGPEILGLNDESIEILARHIAGLVADYVRRELLG